MERMRNRFSEQSGEVNYVTVVLVLMLAGIACAIWVYGPGIYKNYTLGLYLEGQAVKAAEVDDILMRQNIMGKAKELGIDLATLTVEMARYPDKMKIGTKFEYPVPLPGFSDKTVVFRKKIEKKYGAVLHLDENSKAKQN